MRIELLRALFITIGVSAIFMGQPRAGIPDAVHPDYTLKEVPFPVKYKNMGLNFMKDGRMVLSVVDDIGEGWVPKAPTVGTKVMMVTGYDQDDPTKLQIEEISNTFLQLAGATIANDKLYVADRDAFYEIPQLTKPTDVTNNKRLVVKWPDEKTWAFDFMTHQWVFTPIFNKGYFYAPYSGSIRPGGLSNVSATTQLSGAFLKWDLTGKLEAFAGGLREPNGANLDESTGEMFVTDNQGCWLPASTFSLVKQGKFYGHRQTAPKLPNWAENLPYEPPVAWLPYHTVRTSPSQPVVIPKGKFTGDWLIGDITSPGLIRVALDKVNGIYNGAVFFFTQGMKDAALNRLAYGPDGSLYIASLETIAGGWPLGSNQGIYRLTANPTTTAFEMRTVRSLADGLELEFTQPVDADKVVASAFKAVQWQYIRQEGYGVGKQPEQTLVVSGVDVSNDRMRVHLKIADLVIDRTINIKHTGLTSAGKAPWNDESWFTLNSISTRAWDGVTGLEKGVVRNAVTGDALVHLVGPGLVSVKVEAVGNWNATLVSTNGAVVSRQSGKGTSQFQMGGAAHSGLHFLRVEMQDGTLVKKVLL